MAKTLDYSYLKPEVIELLKTKKAKYLTDHGICPTCFDKFSGGAIYGDDTLLKVYEDNDIEILFESRPRAPGHMLISAKDHYQDKSEAPAKLNEKFARFEAELMRIITKVYGCVRVYGCTMCDGPANHYHTQLIPRYPEEERGSDNFVKDRFEYIYEPDKFEQVSNLLKEYAKKHEASANEPKQMD